jgi:signal transduction histidine kinase/CHASE3 domain sensor protein
MNIQLRGFLNVSYILATLSLVAIGISIYRSNDSVLQRARWVAHTHEVITASSKMNSFIKEAQIGQQAFLMSHDSTYLSAYRSSADSIPAYLGTLRHLTRDNPVQQQRLKKLEAQINEHLTQLSDGLTFQGREKTTSLPSFFRSSQSRALVMDIHQLTNTFIQAEERLLQERNQSLDQLRKRTRNIILLVIAAAIIFALFSLVFITNQMRAREAFDRELQQLNQQLSAANQSMNATNEELIASAEELTISNEQLELSRQELETKVRERTAALEESLQKLRDETGHHKRTAEALRESEKRLRIALENAPVIVFSLDTFLRVTWIYSPYLDIISNDEQLPEKTFIDLFSQNSVGQFMKIKQKVLDTGQGVKEAMLVEREGLNRSYILSLEPLFEDSVITGMTGAAYEVTEIKQSEERLKLTMRELEYRNRELDHYVYRVSHDLRAPLTSMMGLISLIEMEDNPEKIAHYVQLIKNRVYRSDDFIMSVLDHSRILNSEPIFTKIDFGKTISDCMDDLKYLPNTAKIQVLVEIHGQAVYYGDQLRISIIFKNMMSNAIKYLNPFEEESYLRFCIRVSLEQAEIVIEDNGIGIEKQYQEKIFDMFFRGTGQADGSGLGLYITRQTILKLQGRIHVESTPGKGARFLIILPNQSSDTSSDEPNIFSSNGSSFLETGRQA